MYRGLPIKLKMEVFLLKQCLISVNRLYLFLVCCEYSHILSKHQMKIYIIREKLIVD